jgi:3-oxoacyl-[acyl-carrier-protein] synthase III
MTGTRFVSTGHFQPGKVLTNHDIAKLVDACDERIRSRAGIRTRHVADPTETVDELAVRAAEEATS